MTKAKIAVNTIQTFPSSQPSIHMLLKHNMREDPVKAEANQKLKDAIIKQFEQQPEVLDSIKTGDNLTVSLPNEISHEFTQEEVESIVNTTIKLLQEDRK